MSGSGIGGHSFHLTWRGWRVRDARGRPVRIVRWFPRSAREVYHFRTINRWKNARVHDRMKLELSPRQTALVRRFSIPLAVLFIIASVTSYLLDWFLVISIFRYALLLGVGYLIFIHLTGVPKKLILTMLNDRACPSCIYPLPQETAEDGCVVCTECGAAWKLGAPDQADQTVQATRDTPPAPSGAMSKDESIETRGAAGKIVSGRAGTTHPPSRHLSMPSRLSLRE